MFVEFEWGVDFVSFHQANIGKLDPNQIFNSKQENKENVKEVPRIGRINPETVFQNSFSEPLRSPENAPKIGKIDLGSVFENGTEENKVQERKVGKLRVQVKHLSWKKKVEKDKRSINDLLLLNTP